MRKACLSVALLMLLSCRSTMRGTPAELQATETFELGLCYGYRGNGTSIFATFGGIARLMDEFGPPEAVVGTSSGSIAAFLTESVLRPNDVYDCRSCTPQQARQRRSFMLKAFPLFIKAYSESDDLAYDLAKVDKAKKLYDFLIENVFNPATSLSGTAGKEPGGDGASANDGIKKLLSHASVQEVLSLATLSAVKAHSREVKNLISEDFYKIVGVGGEARPELIKKVIDNFLLFRGVEQGEGFRRQNLMYPGLINFEHVFAIMGVIGDWYAGYGNEYPGREMNHLLDQCAQKSSGLWWNALAERRYQESTCGQAYYQLFRQYFNARKKNLVPPRRLDEPMGRYLPTWVSTSAISGNAVVAEINRAADQGRWDQIDAHQLGSANFAVLYFGPQLYKARINAKKMMFADTLTQSIVAMDEVPWLVGMRASAQEPATAKSVTYREGDQQYLALGGYVDQLPSKMMRMMGCRTTLAINTTKPIIDFSLRYSPKTWNAFPSLTEELFSPNAPTSAESVAFGQIDAILCSRWSNYGLSEIWEMADNSYHEVIFSKKENLLLQSRQFQTMHAALETRAGEPKSCYGLEEKRGHRFPPYQLP